MRTYHGTDANIEGAVQSSNRAGRANYGYATPTSSKGLAPIHDPAGSTHYRGDLVFTTTDEREAWSWADQVGNIERSKRWRIGERSGGGEQVYQRPRVYEVDSSEGFPQAPGSAHQVVPDEAPVTNTLWTPVAGRAYDDPSQWTQGTLPPVNWNQFSEGGESNWRRGGGALETYESPQYAWEPEPVAPSADPQLAGWQEPSHTSELRNLRSMRRLSGRT